MKRSISLLAVVAIASAAAIQPVARRTFHSSSPVSLRGGKICVPKGDCKQSVYPCCPGLCATKLRPGGFCEDSDVTCELCPPTPAPTPWNPSIPHMCDPTAKGGCKNTCSACCKQYITGASCAQCIQEQCKPAPAPTPALPTPAPPAPAPVAVTYACHVGVLPMCSPVPDGYLPGIFTDQDECMKECSKNLVQSS